MSAPAKTAVLYRMVMPDHVCPYGRKSLWLLRRKGYRVGDRHLTTREQTDAFKAEHGVQTTPQTFIDGKRIGGHDDLRRFFGQRVPEPGATSYTPVLVVFAVAALIALPIAWLSDGPVVWSLVPIFISVAMMLLAMLKLQDLEKFSTMFLNYDLLAQRWPPYGYIYPFAELGAGVLMLAGVLTWLSAPVALIIGGIGAISVFKAVYIDRRALKCACVGGSSNVPLGFVSLSENLAMVGMAVWMLAMPMAMPSGPAAAAPAAGPPAMDHAAPAAMDHAGHGSPATVAFMEGMDRMNRDMAAEMTGDVDADFVAMMIPHHQGAIDMAQVQIDHGSDPEIRALAEAIVTAQETEIAQMRAWQTARSE